MRVSSICLCGGNLSANSRKQISCRKPLTGQIAKDTVSFEGKEGGAFRKILTGALIAAAGGPVGVGLATLYLIGSGFYDDVFGDNNKNSDGSDEKGKGK